MIIDDCEIDIDGIIGSSEYTATQFCPEVSHKFLMKICLDESSYILKVHKKRCCFENELDFMYLFKKNRCKVPKLVKYSTINSSQLWIMYEYVEGISLGQIRNQLPAEALQHVWKQVGKELKKIHSISILNEAEIEENTLNYLYKLKRSIDYCGNYLNHHKIPSVLSDIFYFLDHHFWRVKKSIFCIIFHDFNEKHIIIKQRNEKWNFSTFIDFEETCFGCIYRDFAELYFNTLLDNKELEQSFWAGYDPERLIFDDHSVCFFLLLYSLKLCIELQNIDPAIYHRGLSIIEKTMERTYKSRM